MATETILIDDIDGSREGVETISFTFKGKAYNIDLNGKNSAAFEKALKPYIDKATSVGKAGKSSSSSSGSAPTAYSKLTKDEKDDFRAATGKDVARRIKDEDVQAWIDDGKPAKAK